MKQNKKPQEKRFEKVVEYKYPDGSKFDGLIISWFFSMFIFWILWIILSPLSFFSKSNFCGIRKVYYREVTP